jgi:hypothetical protein
MVLSTCKIIIKDEVNVKIENLDLDTRKALVKKFKFIDPTARFRPSVKLGRWDGSVSFFGIGGTTYLSMVPQILEYLESKNYYIELEDHRIPVNLEFEEIFEDFWGDRTWPEGHRFAGNPIRLRDDQVEVINKFLQNPQCLQEIATGFGKTITTATLAKICEKYGRTITIVPNKSLVEQTEEDFINCGLDVGVYYGDRKNIGKTHTIATWQSLNILDKKSHDDDECLSLAEFLDGVQCVMVDECFHEDSLVLTPTGYRPIKTINPGDKVINYSEKIQQFKEDVVVKHHTNLTNSSEEKMYELEFDNGEKVKVTGNHKFLTTIGWVRADELTEHHNIVNKTKRVMYRR